MRIMSKTIAAALVLATVGTSGCAFFARSAEDYRAVTRELVDTKTGSIRDCYDAALLTSQGASGSVVVNFTVAKKTGTIMNPAVDESSTAPADLSQCVVQAVDGLVLDPPDQRDGLATFTWEFTANG